MANETRIHVVRRRLARYLRAIERNPGNTAHQYKMLGKLVKQAKREGIGPEVGAA